MNKKELNAQYILKVIDSCVESGFKLEEELSSQYRELLKKIREEESEKKFRVQKASAEHQARYERAEESDNEFRVQEASAEHQSRYEQAMEEWLIEIDRELKRVVENFDWLQVFGEDLTSIEAHINKLYELEDNYRQKVPVKDGIKELTIDTKRWVLINNWKRGKRHAIGGTEYQYFLQALLKDNGTYKAMEDFLKTLREINKSEVRTGPMAQNLHGRLKEILKDKVGISTELAENLVHTSKGFSAFFDLVEIK